MKDIFELAEKICDYLGDKKVRSLLLVILIGFFVYLKWEIQSLKSDVKLLKNALNYTIDALASNSRQPAADKEPLSKMREARDKLSMEDRSPPRGLSSESELRPTKGEPQQFRQPARMNDPLD